MKNVFIFIKKQSWQPFIILCLTLGLAPFAPPHLYEKLSLLFRGELNKAIDWFDLFLHGTPWLILSIKTIAHFSKK